MPADVEISNEQLLKNLGRTRKFAVLAVLLGAFGVFSIWWSAPPKPEVANWKVETTGPVTVVYYNSGSRQLLFEAAEGRRQKMLYPLCSKDVGVWPHEFVNITYHWVPYRTWKSGRGPENGEECFEIERIDRLGDDK